MELTIRIAKQAPGPSLVKLAKVPVPLSHQACGRRDHGTGIERTKGTTMNQVQQEEGEGDKRNSRQPGNWPLAPAKLLHLPPGPKDRSLDSPPVVRAQ